MKAFLLLVFIIGVAYATIIATDGVNKWELIYTESIPGSSFIEVELKLTHGTSTIPALYQSAVVCIDTEVSDFTLSADTTGMKSFSSKITATANDSLLNSNAESFVAFASYFYSTSIWTKLIATSFQTPTLSNSDKDSSIIYSLQSSLDLAGKHLPNSTQIYYWKCFYNFKTPFIDLYSPNSDFGAIFSGSTNVEFSGIPDKTLGSHASYLSVGTLATSVIVMLLY